MSMDSPDTRQGWDVERDGHMADYADVELRDWVESYDPDKDPVTKGLTDSDGRVS